MENTCMIDPNTQINCYWEAIDKTNELTAILETKQPESKAREASEAALGVSLEN
jgi:hypothetical protein